MTVRSRRTAMAVAVGLALVLLGFTPTGSADELDERKDRVEERIDSAAEHLDQSSAALTAAEERLGGAVTELHEARTSLARTRDELVEAQAIDRQMQAQLAAAVKELSRARAALARSQASVARRQDALRALVVEQHASGGSELMAIATVLSTQDTVDLTHRLTSFDSVLDAEAATLARLAASQVTQELQESTFEELRHEVAAKRAAAAANLEEKARLEALAEQTATQIESLVALRAEARKAAAHARTEDLRHLEQLEREKADISALLKQRAEEARRAAEAAAAAAAAARKAAEDGDRPDPDRTGQQDPPGPVAPPVTQRLAYPVDGYVTSSYGMRFHPIYKVWKLHDGTDFGAGCGTPVRAAADGTVVSMYYNSGYGNRIILDHGLHGGVGLGTTYNHLSGYSTFAGQHVEQGDVIGYVGTTGASTGCHLHFMVFEDGATVDPMSWL